jgi:glucose-6-phosphate 1-epimerase
MKINLLGAQLHSAEILEGVEIFYSSPLIKKNNIIRGGVPIIFPQFGNVGRLKKHGFARDLNWVKLYSKIINEEEIVKYSLITSKYKSLNWDFEAKLSLTFKLIKNVSLSINLNIQNIGNEIFSFTGGLHPYFFIKNRKNLKIYGLEDSEYIDTDPSINSFHLNGDSGIERLFLTNSDIEVYTGYKTLMLTIEGFENWMVWNPGISGAKYIEDLPDNDWDKFVCIEPLVNNKSIMLCPNEIFNGELKIKVKDEI